MDDKFKLKEKLFGNIDFIGELYKENLLPEKVILMVQMSLLGADVKPDKMTEESLEAGLNFIIKIGSIFDERAGKKAASQANGDTIYARFKTLMNGVEGYDVGQRITLLIKNMLDDRANGWKNARQSVNKKLLTPQEVED